MPLLSRRRSTLDFPLPLQDSSHDVKAAPAPEPSPLPPPSPRRPGPPRTPERPKSEYGLLSAHHLAPPGTPPKQEANAATKRFSMLRWRHFSDSQLSMKARIQAEQEEKPPVPAMPDMPPAPAIITTAPTMDINQAQRSKKRFTPFKRQRSKINTLVGLHAPSSPDLSTSRTGGRKSLSPFRKSHDQPRGPLELHRLSTASSGRPGPEPLVYADDGSTLQVQPQARLSDSSRSDHSFGDHTYGSSASLSTSSFFKLPRRNKRKSLFPLPVRIPPPPEFPDTAPATPRASTSGFSTRSERMTPSPHRQTPVTALQRRHTEAAQLAQLTSPLNSPTHAALAKSSVAFAAPATSLFRNDSSNSTHSARSSPVLAPPRRLGFRDRSSTMSSFGRPSDDLTPPTPPTLGSARNSTSTSGRASLGGFLTLGRFRHGSEPHSPRHGSAGTNSKSNSFAMSREALVIPEREEGDTPGKYLERLEATVSRSLIAGILSKSSDPFAQAVLRSYTRRFPFFGEPIDMSLRKFLLEAELPKETQQVDRVIQAFADRYHECNPGIFMAPDQAYVVAFSLMMLHTDAFNKNNKHKMQKNDYIRNTRGQQVSEEVLACFYDNICYTPFIHFEEEVDINGEKLLTFKPKKSKLKGTTAELVKKPSGPIDPYALICDGKLDLLRPSIKDSISMEDPYSYLGSAKSLDISKLQKAFVNTGILQIVSARSRPAAFESQATRDNPNESKPGVVDLKITKVGILWRKSAKRKKGRSPWQEWGAILTGSQLYLFKNAPWVKGLAHQQHVHLKQGNGSDPVVFKPPITDFKPDALIKTDDAVALHDKTYTRHKHSITLVRHGGQEEVFLADSEIEMNDWLALVNYAAAFRWAGVRIRGFIGAHESADIRHVRLNSANSLQSKDDTDDELLTQRSRIGPQLARQVMAARRQIIIQRIGEAEKEITAAGKRLEDLLRDARHLQVLAPIQPKTREAIIHAAARMDAQLKWVRREIWRTRCHRDILSLDAREDGPIAGDGSDRMELAVPPTPSSTARRAELQRLSSRTSTLPTSPPRSPRAPSHYGRPTTNSSNGTFLSDDVFRTPPEQTNDIPSADAWRLPPLELNVKTPDHHRFSSTSTAHSTSSRQHSLVPSSSNHSLRQPDRDQNHLSPVASDHSSIIRHATSTDHEDVLGLARDPLAPTLTSTTAASSAGPRSSYDHAAAATPESTSRGKSVRRSLHRTLREGHQTSSAHRHRRGKESASTVRSDASRPGDSDVPEGTPGLERGKGKFIVHGKQASVITFGGDWDRERMRLRAEMAQNGKDTEDAIVTDGDSASEARREHDAEEHTDSYSVMTEETDDGEPTPMARSISLKVNAEAAERYNEQTQGSTGDGYFGFTPTQDRKTRPGDIGTLNATVEQEHGEEEQAHEMGHVEEPQEDERSRSRLTFTLGPVTPGGDDDPFVRKIDDEKLKQLSSTSQKDEE